MSINCELDAAKEFREWQPTFLNTYSWAISFSKGCSGGAGGEVGVGGGSDAGLGWIGILSKTITLIEFVL